MKKLSTLLLVLSIGFAQAQTAHQLTGKELICMNEKQTKGFILDTQFEDRTSSCENVTLLVGSINLGTCNERSELMITFEDGTSLIVCSQNRFNCSGTSTFILCPYALEKLATNGVKKIKYRNGYTHQSFTKKLDDPEYFIDLIYDNLDTP